MNFSRSSHPNWVWLDLLTLFATVMFLKANAYHKYTFTRPNMTELSARISPLFERTKPVCFGRLMIDVPATATVVYGPADVDFPIVYIADEAKQITAHVAKEVEKFEKESYMLHGLSTTDFAMYGKVIDGAVQGQKLVFGSKGFIDLTIVSFIPLGKDLYIQDGGSPFKQIEKHVGILNKAAKNLRLRAEDEIPTESGLCIEGGFARSEYDFEKASIGIRLKEFPDVHFSIESLKNGDYLVPSDDIEELIKDAREVTPHGPGTWYSKIDFLRRGQRQIAHWTGSEVLVHLPAQKTATSTHEFHFTSNGAINDRIYTRLDIELDTGVQGNRKGAIRPSLNDAEAIALWDRLVSTLKIRPTQQTAK
ncbi:hypothetical protein GTP27_04030 [Pseudoduganella sp. CY13W]|uniref:Tle cognate immunity protein 4 C-terminal domain-containing protein n=2 Tax=Duganella qianjiadongensis TaxID=2692176 RepID=A0ABW9VFW0_9BURK|nr:hypothetical protein [Duganella qianjiadongensis]